METDCDIKMTTMIGREGKMTTCNSNNGDNNNLVRATEEKDVVPYPALRVLEV